MRIVYSAKRTWSTLKRNLVIFMWYELCHVCFYCCHRVYMSLFCDINGRIINWIQGSAVQDRSRIWFFPLILIGCLSSLFLPWDSDYTIHQRENIGTFAIARMMSSCLIPSLAYAVYTHAYTQPLKRIMISGLFSCINQHVEKSLPDRPQIYRHSEGAYWNYP